MSNFSHVKFTKPASAGWLVDIEHLTVVGESADTVVRSLTIQCRPYPRFEGVFEDMSGVLFRQDQESGDLDFVDYTDLLAEEVTMQLQSCMDDLDRETCSACSVDIGACICDG